LKLHNAFKISPKDTLLSLREVYIKELYDIHSDTHEYWNIDPIINCIFHRESQRRENQHDLATTD